MAGQIGMGDANFCDYVLNPFGDQKACAFSRCVLVLIAVAPRAPIADPESGFFPRLELRLALLALAARSWAENSVPGLVIRQLT